MRHSWTSLLLSVPLAIFIYALLSMTPDRQNAFLGAIVVFLALTLSPIASAYFTARMNARDAARWEREEADALKRPVLLVSLGNGRETEFFPVGGHRKPNSAIAFHVYLENSGDAAAQDITVTIGLPPHAHPADLPPEQRPRFHEDGSIEWQTIERDVTDVLAFKPNVLPNEMGSLVGVIELQRPLYAEQSRHIGLAVVTAPEGTIDFPWLIESSKGRFHSSEGSSLRIKIHDQAIGHDRVDQSSSIDPGKQCRLCATLQNMPQWAGIVDQRLEKYRALDVDKNPDRKPWVSFGGYQFQWYQHWTGPHRWVTCEAEGGREQTVRAYFWVEGQWEHRRVVSVSMAEVEQFAEQTWLYLKPY